jgi:hypothetical protein
MKKTRTACAALALSFACFTAAAAADPGAWTLSVQQPGKKPSLQAASTPDHQVRLQRAPFSLVFTGPQAMGFAVLAAQSCKHLEGLAKAPDRISEAIRPTNIGAEGDAADNTFLIVNATAVVAANEATAHAWSEDKDNDIHSFQHLKPAPAGQVTSTREVKSIMVQVDSVKSSTVPVSQYPDAQICLLATGLPPVGHMAHTQPKLVRLSFE